MNRHTLSGILLVLSFLGLADSAYLADAALTNATLACNIDGLSGCNVVAQSIYSHFFGVPLGVYGLAFYGILFILGATVFVKRTRFVHHALVILGGIGALASVIFLCIQLFLIKALCVYCLGSALISFLICFLTLTLWRKHMPKKAVSGPSNPPVEPVPGA